MDFISFSERERTTPWTMMKLESHPYFELYFILEGDRTIIVKDTLLTLNQPSAIIIPPFTPHRTEGGPYRRINVYISPQLLDEKKTNYLNENKAPCLFALDQNAQKIIYPLLATACSFDKDNSSSALDDKKAFFYTILYFLKQCPIINLEEHNNKLNKNDTQLLSLVTYLNEHWNERITLTELCQMFFISKSHLCKIFKNMMGCSISDYLLFIRLNHAKEMLFTTDKSIQLIADDCGFSSLNYFSLMFREKIGISPTAYRKTR